MKLAQHAYMSAEAQRLRRRDGTHPAHVHPCELDSLGDTCPWPPTTAGWQGYWAARALREQIEGTDAPA